MNKIKPFLEELELMENFRICGLMSIPPRTNTSEEARKHFIALRDLKDQVNAMQLKQTTITHLSMGMSQDYEVAIEEGATMVRVGQAIFGPRP